MQTSKFCLPTGYLVSLSLFLPLYKGDRYPPQGGRGGLNWVNAFSVTQSSVHDREGWWPWLRLTRWVWWFHGSSSLCQHYLALVGCIASPNGWPEASPLWGSLFCNSFLSQIMEISGSQEAETSQKGFALPLFQLYQMYHPGSSFMAPASALTGASSVLQTILPWGWGVVPPIWWWWQTAEEFPQDPTKSLQAHPVTVPGRARLASPLC